jgi:thioredoxin reductase
MTMRGRADVLIIGGGPAGLTAAWELRQAGCGSVVVVDREQQLGGIPRHANHQGYGLRDLHRTLTGPNYATRLLDRAASAGAELRAGTQATGWTHDDGLAVEVTSRRGRTTMHAASVVLATGCRERPRSARLVPGTRPQGVMTTGMLQQLVYLLGEQVGRRAVIVGAEHVSYSALMTLAHGGAETVAMVTELPRHQSYAAFAAGARIRFGAPLLTERRITAIRGRPRVTGVQLTDLRTGATEEIACDTLVFTADWIPDHELAVARGLSLDSATKGPIVDPALRTTVPGVFAVGNLLHGAETADVAALSGAHVRGAVTEWLQHGRWPQAMIPVRVAEPLQWIVPNAIVPHDAGTPPRNRFLLRAHQILVDATIEIAQGERPLWRRKVPRVMPGRSTRLPAAWTAAVVPDGPDVLIRVLRARQSCSTHRK